MAGDQIKEVSTRAALHDQGDDANVVKDLVHRNDALMFQAQVHLDLALQALASKEVAVVPRLQPRLRDPLHGPDRLTLAPLPPAVPDQPEAALADWLLVRDHVRILERHGSQLFRVARPSSAVRARFVCLDLGQQRGAPGAAHLVLRAAVAAHAVQAAADQALQAAHTLLAHHDLLALLIVLLDVGIGQQRIAHVPRQHGGRRGRRQHPWRALGRRPARVAARRRREHAHGLVDHVAAVAAPLGRHAAARTHLRRFVLRAELRR
mmetsp:Transcript_21962/g.55966  ORF Transcript_21962/g.55966 Transcript_21962/m.55966 type:complete len:264 (-) Transcript_21962:212-1003(-)